jgi:uncharacterized protein (TIGR03084 family)
VSHLWFFDGTAWQAATDVGAFESSKAELVAAGARGADLSVDVGRVIEPPSLLAAWRRDRDRLVGALRSLDPKVRLPWYGPAMGARSFATARLMETWAHGQDVVDALGVTREPTDRLRHVAHIGVGARPFSYAVRAMAMPDLVPRVELVGPSGDRWTWGPEGSPDVVRGDALDFCLAVTQRRHLADVDLVIDGDGARQWMAIAQAYAGPAGPGRAPGRFRGR